MRRKRSAAAILAGVAATVAVVPLLVANPGGSDTLDPVATGHGWSGSTLEGPRYAHGSCHARSQGGKPLPDPACTPGAYDTAVTQRNLKTTICAKGYTATVRPPLAVTSRPKRESALEYGVPAVGEYDHLIPLELGGSSDTRNLWLEPGSIPNPKDKVENALKALVCAGTITLSRAQLAIAKDWTTALQAVTTR
jgi:hypothetical protein